MLKSEKALAEDLKRRRAAGASKLRIDAPDEHPAPPIGPTLDDLGRRVLVKKTAIGRRRMVKPTP